MIRRTLARTLLRLARWRVVGQVPRTGIMVGAPHTSNWDWVATLVMLWSQDVTPRILIKRELFRGPLGWLLKATGGIPVDRDNASQVVGDLAAHAARDESFLIAIAAEGTRERSAYWKSGFYRLAQDTGLPVSLGYIDGPSRTVGFGPTFTLTGDVRADMDRIREFYSDKRGIHPELRTEPRLREELAAGQS
ncbi:1-acyl-sn-glycerol-3-phosphate acyltransferase [Nocardioides houyundeii]|uniref:1-acyl-sn-glycerol-3-phosphate acyltransferase n=1 Tax=Nocardioides houyundeii TaxID=2045452 RepID=UPI000C775B15|nr:1-acyl-sn-glycerol-3-phosphate acyltransferase [Nocardioides houyundeii]